MIVNDIGLTEDSYSNIYTADGSEIGTVYDREGRVIYYMYRDTIGDGSRVFTSYGAPIKDYKIYGDTIQNGIPSPDMPVDVVGCGEWDSVANSYKLPVTTTNRTDTVTTSIYVGSESLHRIDKYADYVDYSSGKTVRRIKKLVLTGEENWRLYALPGAVNVERFLFVLSQFAVSSSPDTQVSSHFPIKSNNRDMEHMRIGGSSNDEMYIYIRRLLATTVAGLKSYLAAQYAAGTPVTVWYVPATPIEEDPPVLFPELPTLSGTNTLTVDTTVKPSEIDLTGRIKTSGYGQLLDKNLTAINDSTGTPIFVRG